MEFKTYREAHLYARAQANLYKQSYGIEAPTKYQGFTVKMIPRLAKNRYGFEARIEPVDPETYRGVEGGIGVLFKALCQLVGGDGYSRSGR